ncbi:MAG: PAS domain S-box protein [Dehalococcoidales bacterium]|nr:MAG: PAS domain S-box protein [Dehalococcoidales bacterium]
MSESLWESVERTYRSSEIRYKLLAENVTDVIWTMDLDFQYTYVSPSVSNMRGISPEDAVKQTLAETLTSQSYQEMMKVLFEELAIESSKDKDLRRSRTLDLDQKCLDGSIIHTETKITFLRDTENSAVGILGVTRDITERIRIEDQLKQSELLASLGKMTAGIAHEVNNPLGSILLYSELMMNSEIPVEVKKDLKVIHDEARRAARIMSDLLTYSLGGSNNIRKVDLHQVLRKVLDMRLYTQTIHNIDVSISLIDGPLYIFGDKAQLSQVFMNIMLNAEEALDESSGGNIYIETSVDDDWARVAISDAGTGIPEENLSQVFYPVFPPKDIGEGTGLGLSTCYGIGTSHGGLIRAENNNMGGATIVIELPKAMK